jgi:hypothetical protein
MAVGKYKTPDGIEICYEMFGEENNVPPIARNRGHPSVIPFLYLSVCDTSIICHVKPE